MARIVEPTQAQVEEWKAWVAERPEVVREIAERLEPWSLYRLKTTDQRVTLYSISEDGTVTVDVTGQFNRLLFERRVFGIDPDDLEPCELPTPGEPLGMELSQEEAERRLPEIRQDVSLPAP